MARTEGHREEEGECLTPISPDGFLLNSQSRGLRNTDPLLLKLILVSDAVKGLKGGRQEVVERGTIPWLSGGTSYGLGGVVA